MSTPPSRYCEERNQLLVVEFDHFSMQNRTINYQFKTKTKTKQKKKTDTENNEKKSEIIYGLEQTKREINWDVC